MYYHTHRDLTSVFRSRATIMEWGIGVQTLSLTWLRCPTRNTLRQEPGSLPASHSARPDPIKTTRHITIGPSGSFPDWYLPPPAPSSSDKYTPTWKSTRSHIPKGKWIRPSAGPRTASLVGCEGTFGPIPTRHLGPTFCSVFPLVSNFGLRVQRALSDPDPLSATHSHNASHCHCCTGTKNTPTALTMDR